MADIIIRIISATVAVACIAVLLYHRHRTKRLTERLARIIDEAIAGTFNETIYDESRLSQMETKLWRFLTASKLSRRQTEKERDKIKSLISDISHQTKTPIANILMYSELLLEQDDLPEKARKLAGQIRPQAEKLNFLIQSLIKSSRLESGIIAVHPSPGEVSRLMASAAAGCFPKAEAKGILLTVDESPGLFALFDLKWTSEALYNIIDNAVKYTPAGGRVTVSATAYEMFVRIDVRDTGIGIHEAEYARLYERFWRSGSVSNTNISVANNGIVEGVGIGLYLAREIVAMQDGYIKVASVLGQGSLFSVFLPKA